MQDRPPVAVEAAPEPAIEPRIPAPADGVNYNRRAEAAFQAGDYNQALRLANHALVESPRDGKLFLFTGQALLAVGDYRTAAAAIHQGVALLEPKDWGYAVANFRRYYRGNAYVEQMERLNEFITKNPDAAYARFVRGYQHGFLGHKEAARRDLAKALELESRDELAARLVEHFGGTAPAGRSPGSLTGGGADSGHDHSGHSHGDDGHKGHDHGGHDHGDRSPLKAPASSPPLLDDLNVPLAVDAAPKTPGPQTVGAVPKGLLKLTAADRAAALAQGTCPVTGDELGEMGTPIKVRVRNRDVFVCCEGCVQDIKNDPDTYLAGLAKRT